MVKQIEFPYGDVAVAGRSVLTDRTSLRPSRFGRLLLTAQKTQHCCCCVWGWPGQQKIVPILSTRHSAHAQLTWRSLDMTTTWRPTGGSCCTILVTCSTRLIPICHFTAAWAFPLLTYTPPPQPLTPCARGLRLAPLTACPPSPGTWSCRPAH